MSLAPPVCAHPFPFIISAEFASTPAFPIFFSLPAQLKSSCAYAFLFCNGFVLYSSRQVDDG